MKKSVKIAIIALVFVAAIAAIIIFATAKSSGATYDDHLQMAEKYLDELKYDQAIAEYMAAIELESANTEAYKKLADIYAEMGDYEAAADILSQGIAATGSEELQKYADEIKDKILAYANQEESTNKDSDVSEVVKEDSDTGKEPEPDSQPEPEAEQEAEPNGGVGRIFGVTGDPVMEIDPTAMLRQDVNLTEETTVDEMDGSSKMSYYNGSGILVRSIICDAGGSIVTDAEFCDNGDLLKLVYYNYDNTIDFIDVYCYDENGRHGRTCSYNADGKIRNYMDINEYGYATCEKYYENGEVVEYIVHEYHNPEVVSKQVSYYGNGKIKEGREYDEASNLVSEYYYSETGQPILIMETMLDENGNKMQRTTQYKEDGSVEFYFEYKYDENGNYTEMGYYADGTPMW